MFNFAVSSKVNRRKKEMPVQLELDREIFFHVSHLVGDDEEVYEATSGPGSIRDIWKKFDLGHTPLTPPLSPSRKAATSGDVSPSCLTSSAADTLQCVSDILDLDNCRTVLAEQNCANLTSKLIQDCMWGSHSLAEKVRSKRRVENVYDTPCSTPPASFYPFDLVVDPASVFPYPINTQEFPSASGESSSEDEIDVVTIIEKPVKRKSPAPNNIAAPKILRDEPAAKKAKITYKRPRENINKDMKEACPSSSEAAQEVANRLAAKEKCGEDTDCKRNVHNVLERKRRNDLKYSFQVLRDSIPDLKGSERAPKVAILRRATDCILKLRTEQESLLDKKNLLEKARQSKLQKLKSLEEAMET